MNEQFEIYKYYVKLLFISAYIAPNRDISKKLNRLNKIDKLIPPKGPL